MSLTEIKILVIGSANVGKTSLVLSWSDSYCFAASTTSSNQFHTKPTLGVDLVTKIVKRNGQKYKVVIWDTAGTERFRGVTSSYYRNAHGVIIVYDVCSKLTFNELEHWINESSNEKPIPIRLVVGNKIDLEKDRKVNGEVVYELLNKFGEIGPKMLVKSYYEVTIMDRNAVYEVFDDLISKIVDTGFIQRVDNNRTDTTVDLGSSGAAPKSSSSTPCIRC